MGTTINSRSQLRPAVHTGDHLMGTGLASVMLVLFGDYECQHSRKVDAVIRQQVLRALPGEVDYVFRHFPLVKIHPRAQTAALAAEAAAAQDAFWPMHDLLFLNQRHLRFPDLESYAAHLGLDLARFRADVIDGRYLLRIRDDLRSGVGSGVQALPTVFLNGYRLDPSMDPNWIIDEVRSALRAITHRPTPAITV